MRHKRPRLLSFAKVALDAFEKLATLYQDVGPVDRQDFQLARTSTDFEHAGHRQPSATRRRERNRSVNDPV